MSEPEPVAPFRRGRLLHDALERAARLVPDDVAVWAGEERLTFGELEEASTRFAAGLQQRGFERGDRGAVFLENGTVSAVALYGILKAGGVFVVVNPQTRRDKLGYILSDGSVRLLVTDPRGARTASAIVGGVPSLDCVVVPAARDSLPPWPADGPELLTLHEALAPEPDRWRRPATIPLDLAALLYTSGSTGHPKGVMQTHQSMTFAAGSIIEYLRLGRDDVLLGALPLSFDYGLYQLLMAVELGATLVLERSFAYPGRVFERMKQREVTVFPGVPTIFGLILQAHAREPLRFPSVRRVTNTADALPPSYIDRLREIFPEALVFPMYGQTECKRVSYLEPELVDARPGSVGKAIPGTEVLLLGPDGEEVGPGKPGILHVRGPHVMLGYWNDPEATARALRPGPLPGERMLSTGDWFRMDEDGFLYFLGRSDDIVKTGGEKVSPVEVERALHSVPGVAEAAAVAVPDDLLGQALRAFVVMAPGAEASERTLRRELSQRLESFMVPRDIVFSEALPRTPHGKLARRELA